MEKTGPVNVNYPKGGFTPDNYAYYDSNGEFVASARRINISTNTPHKELCCAQCKEKDEIWPFKTHAMPRKIYLCWEHLVAAERKLAERGKENLFK